MRINQENKSVDMESRDINYILPAYVRSYLFYNKNEMPEKIIFPMFPSVQIGSVVIPIEYLPPLDAIAVEIAEDGANVAEVTPEQEAVLDGKDEEIKELKAQVKSLTTIERGEDEVGGSQPMPICGAYAEHWKKLGKPEGWKGCSLPKGHEGNHTDEVDGTEAVTEIITPAPEDLLRQQQEDAMPDEPPTTSPAKTAFAKPEPKLANPIPSVERQPKMPPGGDIGPGSPLSDTQPRDSRDQIRTARDLVEEPEIEGTAEKPFEKEISRGEDGKPIVEEKPDAVS